MVSVAVVWADAWASGVAVLERSCDATSLQGFDVTRDPSFTVSSRVIGDVSRPIQTP